ncbi:pre-mRNA 3'-end-processing factor FIP1 isoform X2 [Phymastichus coffea]|uniref:pre-mRNA 3'-end-processing factor FIP1 isoform X2 n=1 Tax=Phymastichus coffea TaxID=108790 RepID=UPI00273AF695|nr:pre-mRNA 3'-end-processing factor FIP1 isoform X2 [Phymastichus coffea]
MADENEDQWLYGDSVDEKDGFHENPDSQPAENEAIFNPKEEPPYQQNEDAQDGMEDQQHEMQQSVEDGGDTGTGQDDYDQDQENDQEQQQQRSQEENSMTNEMQENGTNDSQNHEDGERSDSDSDDDVHVVIGDIKSAPAQYSGLNIKRTGNLITSSTGGPEKSKQQPGKFSIDEFETMGSINGIPAHEYNLDTLEDKPWRQPGADITDYFNYGFNEETWRAYCERQKRMRSESGAGLILNSGPKRAGPPPGRKMAGTIDVIGSSGLGSRRGSEKSPPKENVIQVMTGDRREYSRKQTAAFPDMSVPPPGPPLPASFDMPPPGYPEPAPYFVPEPDPYYHNSYEPTQDRAWGDNPSWQSASVNISLAGGDDKDHKSMVPPSMPPMMREGRDRDRDRERDRGRDRDRDYEESMMRDRDRERDRDRDRDRDKESRREERDIESSARDEERERDRSRSQYRHKESRHRHRSRSKSRRHRSRSRSQSRRKKKSRRSERERSKEESE